MAERYLVLTCFKNEAPFILEWIAYHQAIGFDDFLIYTNDCDDGTDEILARLSELGVVHVRDNAIKPGQRPSPQARAYKKALRERVYKRADWVAVIDADEFINVHVGDHSIRALTKAAENADAISLTWRLFGSNGRSDYEPGFLIEQHTRAAPQFCPRPPQAWGMKTIIRREAFTGLGVHRPRTPIDDDWSKIRWVDGNGRDMPEKYHNASWRHGRDTYGYELAQVNHYSTRSQHSYLMKQMRGRAFGGHSLDLDYWVRMNRNEEEDMSIQRMLSATQKKFDAFMQDKDLRDYHQAACETHAARIQEVLKTPETLATIKNMQAQVIVGDNRRKAG